MSLVPWLVIGLLISANALYVAAEFAGITVPRSQLALLRRDGNQRAGALLSLLKNSRELDRYIAACQIGITLASVLAGAYGQATIAFDLRPMLQQHFDLEVFSAHSAAAAIVLLGLATLQMVFGELIPKSLALRFPEKVALGTYLPMRWSMVAYGSFIWLLNGSAFLLLKPFGIRPGGHEHVHSASEIALLFSESSRGGVLNPEIHRRLQRGLQLSKRLVRQIMVPRSELVAIEALTPPQEIIQRVLQSPYSRLPVYEHTLDHIIGTVSIKDVVGLYAARGQVPRLEQVLRPIPFVPGNLTAERLVRFLQEQRSSKAIVVDEFGGVQGLVSIDDVLGDLFGDIGDELKEFDSAAIPLPDGRVRLLGSMPPAAAEQWIGSRWNSSAATISGHIVQSLGRLPSAGEQLEIDGVQVNILEMNPKTISRIELLPPEPETEEEVS